MIVQGLAQDAPASAARFVSKNTEHTALSAQLAEAFGNDDFAPLEPREEMLYLIAHHDHGWATLDAAPGIDDQTGLPYNLVQTPLTDLVKTSRGSPDFNEAHSSWCGLLSSMHTYGLYHGRYGMSDKVVLDFIPDEAKPTVNAMLENEIARQSRLSDALADNKWAQPPYLMHNYKLLQFFDTAALYFNLSPPGERGESEFTHIPTSLDTDVTVKVREVESGVYAYSPFPFRAEGIEVHCEGRYLSPDQGRAATKGQDGKTLMANSKIQQQTFTLIAG
jgi:hypothetical protein